MKRLLLAAAAVLALTGAAHAGDRLPAAYLGHWCENGSSARIDSLGKFHEGSGEFGFYSAKKPGAECATDGLILKPHKLVDADGERECRFRSIRKMSERTVEIIAYCRAEEAPGYIQKMWLTTYSKGTIYFEEETRE
jgi:hypothetical protein